jgi:periplasmic divalent cation tolerance protein
MINACILLTTLDDMERAKQLGRQLVELHLAACVNMVERVHSIYRWQGNVETTDEVLLIIKTAVERVPALKEKIVQLHPYEVPEIVVLQIADSNDPYLAWLLAASQDDAK